MWALAGILLLFKGTAPALYFVGLFATSLRPTTLLRMFAADVINPESTPGPHPVLIVSPFGKVGATKSGYYDGTVTLDGTVSPALGRLLRKQANHKLKTREPHLNIENVRSVETFAPKSRWTLFERRANTLAFDSDITTIYQARHGGASRNLTLGTRTTQDVAPRGFWTRLGSTRTCRKLGSMQQQVKKADPAMTQHAANVRDNFENHTLKSRRPKPPRAKRGNSSETYPPTDETKMREWDGRDSTRLENSSRDPPTAGRPPKGTELQ